MKTIKNLKTMQIIMLLADKTEGSIFKYKDFLYGYNVDCNTAIPYHLYIISDNEIKEGDWCVDKFTNQIFQITKERLSYDEGAQKIEITTDPTLRWSNENDILVLDPYFCKLPQISYLFIEQYARLEGKITEVQVEMEETLNKIKVDENNNAFIHLNEEIVKVKTYSSENIEKAFLHGLTAGRRFETIIDNSISKELKKYLESINKP